MTRTDIDTDDESPADVPNPRCHHTYLAIDGWDYWTMGEPVGEVELINRARLTDGWR